MTRRFARRSAPTKASTSSASSTGRDATSSSTWARAPSGVGTLGRTEENQVGQVGVSDERFAEEGARAEERAERAHAERIVRQGAHVDAGHREAREERSEQARGLLGIRGVGERVDQTADEGRVVVARGGARGLCGGRASASRCRGKSANAAERNGSTAAAATAASSCASSAAHRRSRWPPPGRA